MDYNVKFGLEKTLEMEVVGDHYLCGRWCHLDLPHFPDA